MTNPVMIVFSVLALGLLWHAYVRVPRRYKFIAQYQFNPAIKVKLAEKYPHLCEADRDRVIEELRYFFLINLKHSAKMAMPSRIVDTAWHAFMLLDKEYRGFCKIVYGHYLAPIFSPCKINRYWEKLNNAWCWSCQEECLNPEFPLRMPRLFAVDAELSIADVFAHCPDDANHPREIVWQSPLDLCQKISIFLNESATIERPIAIGMLSRAINLRFSSNAYCRCYSQSDFDQLLEAIFNHEDLTLSIFGGTNATRIKAEYANKLGYVDMGF